jgi:hypothetical protein
LPLKKEHFSHIASSIRFSARSKKSLLRTVVSENRYCNTEEAKNNAAFDLFVLQCLLLLLTECRTTYLIPITSSNFEVQEQTKRKDPNKEDPASIDMAHSPAQGRRHAPPWQAMTA